MALKKKYLGGLKVLLLPLFIMLLGAFSTCFASTSLTSEQAQYLHNYFFTNTYNSDILAFQRQNLFTTQTVWAKKLNNDYQSFMTFFNSNNDLEISAKTWFFTVYTSNNDCYFYIFNFNNTMGNEPYLYLKFSNTSDRDYQIKILAIDDNHSAVSYTGRRFKIRMTGSDSSATYSYSNYESYTLTTSGLSTWFIFSNFSPFKWNTSNSEYSSTLDYIPGITNFAKTPVSIVYSNFNGISIFSEPQSYFYKNFSMSLPESEPEPEEPSNSTGTITNPSGEITGTIDLTNIENGIIDINNSINTQAQNIVNQISGDTQKIIDNQTQNTNTIINFLSGDANFDDKNITSGDIESSLGFQIAEDPYSNFWLTLTNNLKAALLGVNRSIDISFQNRTWTISLDEYFVLPPWLTIILLPFSTAFFTWILARQWKHIFDKLSSGNVDSLLKENSEERHL